MSSTTQQNEINADTPWLERNTRLLDFGDESIKESDSWERAKSNAGDADVDRLDERGRFDVQLPGGDSHDVLIVSTPNTKEYVGACDCRGWRMHPGGPCAHVATMAMQDVMTDVVPLDEDYAEELAFGTVDGSDVVEEARNADGGSGEVVATTVDDQAPEVIEDDGVQEESDDAVVDDRPDRADAGDGRDDHAAPPTPSTEKDRPVWAQTMPEGALSDPLDELPDWMLTEVDRRDGDVDLNKRGCQVVARALGLDWDIEYVVEARDTGFEYATVRAIVTDTDGHKHTSTANAHVDEDNVSMDGIDEMAETRAKKRAVKWATGGGLEAVLETDEL